ncbi:site-specific integrase [Leeuwenhoekiella sp. NPDC079379]|uniref:site-specific integrase n=1 Tax=Leeuwenhoekiella sp. NPDC079379 TaxID=3364122 RepID=UPI0037C6053C
MGTSNTFNIHFWLNLSKRNEDLAPIYARITVNGKRAEISLQKQTSVTFWDTKLKQTNLRSAEGKALNSYLDQVYTKLLTCHNDLLDEFNVVTARSIKARFLGQDQNNKTLLELVTYHNEKMEGILKPGTLKNYYTTKKYIQHFLIKKKNSPDLFLKQINYSFIIDFEHYLRKGTPLQTSNPLSNNGIMKHLERLRKLMNFALDLGWLEKNPFARYRLKFSKFEKQYLTKDELQKIETADLKISKLQIVRDIFIFACYTGLSFIDIKNLHQNNIVKGIDDSDWIFTQREKNGQVVKVPLLPIPLHLLSKYQKYSELHDGLLFPVYSNQKVNSYLKDIATLLKIPKHLTFHSARHTFATSVTLANGVPIETVSKMLGHSKISTTQIYARVLEEKISSDIEILRTRL